MRRRITSWLRRAALLATVVGVVGLVGIAPRPPVAMAGPGPATEAPDRADDVRMLREQVDALVHEHVGVTTPGAMVAVVGPDGPILRETWGMADPVARTPLTLDSRTPVASVSKVVTALTALTLHHQGHLDLDADIRDDLPVRDERDVRTPVTGRHLLTHHSGIAESLFFHPDPPGEPVTGPLLPALQANPPLLAHTTDAGLHYSALQAYALLGAAIEQATGTSFDDAAARWVLEPAGAEDADFHGPSDRVGDVVLTSRQGGDWQPAGWPPVHERPAASLTWSTRDAAAVLETLVSGDGLPAAVIEEANTTAVRPAHGGGGHTQVFFESWRADVRVLEHAGANGVAWLALVPSADVGVFAAVTTEDSGAAPFTWDVVDTVAAWTARTGRAGAEPIPREGLETITPPWASPLEPVEPVGAFHQRLFAATGPELALRTLTGQFRFTVDGRDVRLGERVLSPSATPGRWCDADGCVAAVQDAAGNVTVLLGGGGMLEQTLVAAPWWADRRFVGTAAAAAVMLAIGAVGGALRAWWHRRRGVPAAVSRPLALAWSLLGVGLIVATPLVPLSSLTGISADWIPSDGAAVWALRLVTAAHLVLGVLWSVRAIRRCSELPPWRRLALVPVLLAGLAVCVVLVTWALPTP